MRNPILRFALVLTVAIFVILLYAGVAVSGPAMQEGPGELPTAPAPQTPPGFAPPPIQQQLDNGSATFTGEGSQIAVSGELLVKPKDSGRRAEMASLHMQLGAQVVGEIDDLGVQIVQVPRDQAEAALSAYQADPRVAYAEPNYIAHIFDVPNDPLYSQQWALAKMKAAAGWDYTHGSPDVVIAIIDTGVTFNHPDLQGKFVQGYDFVNNDSFPDDDHGHGTHVSGIAAANSDNGVGISGVCRECRLMPIKVLAASGSGNHSAIAQGITWAADHGARVINMSLGGAQGSQTMADAVTYAWNKGVVIVAAAGNDSSSMPNYPAAYPQVISVSATDSSDGLANFSNYGSTIAVGAPGASILSCTKDGGYQAWSGTSMASPNVAGLAGLIISQNPGMSASSVRQRIQSTADDLGSAGRDDKYGYGRINVERALGSNVPPPPPITATRTPTKTPTPDPCVQGENPTELEQQVIDLINVERRNVGLNPVRTEIRLVEAARLHSQDMANHSFLDHTGSDGSSPWDRIARAGYPMVTGGETIGGGYPSAQAIVEGWMGSAPHKAILLGSEFQDIGVGYAYNDNSTYRHYWTADFGVSQDGGQVPPTPTGTPDCPTHTPSVTATRTPTKTPTLTPSPTPTLCTSCTDLAITPVDTAAGWVLSSEAAGNHFGDDDMYTGYFGGRIYHGAMQFDLSSVPAGAQVTAAWVEMTGQTREYMSSSGGAWNLRLLPQGVDASWSSRPYSAIHNAGTVWTIPPDVQNGQMNTNVVNTFIFTSGQLQLVAARLASTRLISFRLDGPESGVNNAFSWDSGYGEGGLLKPPVLHLTILGGSAPPTITPSATSPATSTKTPVVTPSRTWTPAVLTSTPTRTPVVTSTPPAGSVVVTLTPAANLVGWVMGNEPTGNHFGDDDIYAGVFSTWVHHGAIQFDLSSIPPGVQILGARLLMTGQSVDYLTGDGAWQLRLLNAVADGDWANSTYATLHNQAVIYTVPPPLGVADLGINVVNTFTFEPHALVMVEQRLNTTQRISFRVDGPDIGANNVFSWDSGYGAGGLGIKPVLMIEYTSNTGGPTRTPAPTWTRPATNTPAAATATPVNSRLISIDLTPESTAIGWVRQGDTVGNHLGDDDVYAGIYAGYVYYGAAQFRLSAIPANADFISASMDVTGQDRQYTAYAGGEWNLRLLDGSLDNNWGGITYDSLRAATVAATIPPTFQNADCQAGKRNTFTFNGNQLKLMQTRLSSGLISFRFDGPVAGDTNVFSWDSGFGTGGLLTPPVLHVTYRIPLGPPT